LYPFREQQSGNYRTTRLWQSLNRLGIGAIPLLPGSDSYLAEWLRSLLREGGWTLGERAIAHISSEKVSDWRNAAARLGPVGALRSPGDREHLDWILSQRIYYLPLSHQRRLFSTKWLAIYLPVSMSTPGTVRYYAPVESIDVVPRSAIATPWQARRDTDERQ